VYPNGTKMEFRNRNTGEVIEGSVNELIPPDSDVWFGVEDIPDQYSDNCQDPTSPLRIRLITPLHPDIFQYPAKYHPGGKVKALSLSAPQQ